MLTGALISGGAAVVRADDAADLARARDLETREQWAPAESLATAALTRLEAAPAPDSLQIAEALYLLGVAKWHRVGYAEGAGPRAAWRSLGIRERRLGTDHLAVAEAHSLMGRFLLGSGRADSALAEARRALDIRARRLAPDDTLLAMTWDQIALIQRSRRDFHACLDAWTHAIEIQERVHGWEHPEVALLLAQTGVPWMELGDLERARRVLEESLDIFARTAGPDARDRWIPLNILADVEERSGNEARNLDLLQEALRIVRLHYGEDSRMGLTLRANLAISLQNFHDPFGARAMLAPLLPLYEAQYGPTGPRTTMIRYGLALASLAAGDTAAATRLLHEVEATLAARPGPPDPLLALVLGNQGEILYRQGRYAESRALLESSIQADRSGRQPRPTTLAGAQEILLLTYEAEGDTAATDRALQKLLKIGEDEALGSTPDRVDLLYAAAGADRSLGRRDEAWARALEAERLSRESLRNNLQALPDRRALQLTQFKQRYLELVIELARQGGEARREAAWDRLMRTRGLVRAEVARRRPAPGFESDTGFAGAHERWMAAERRLAQRLVNLGGVARDSLDHAALEDLRASAEDAEAIYARMLANRGATIVPAEVGLDEVRSHLRPGQALVGFYRSLRTTSRWMQVAGRDTSDLYAFVMRDAGPVELIALGTSLELEAGIAPWRERVATSPGPGARPGDRAERECRRQGLQARALIWDRLAPHVAGATDVFMVADDPLLNLPWQALPEGEDRYLVESGPRIHVFNAERELADPAAPAGSGSLLAIGNPDFDHGAAGNPSMIVAAVARSAPDPCSGGALRSLAPLPGSGAEAEEVAGTWRARGIGRASVLTGAAATESAFKHEARGRSVIHLATHGVVTSDTCAAGASGTRGVGGVGALAEGPGTRPTARPAGAKPSTRPEAAARSSARSPWMSRRVWLALAGANHADEHRLDENEGYLTAEEVLTLDLEGTDWVVLSACHSGLAEAWSRDGTLGMRRAFDLAGVRTVIASQWAVEDEATREWMQALYEARAGGVTNAAAAIESASRSVLAARRKAGRSTHPFYWAAFSASGE